MVKYTVVIHEYVKETCKSDSVLRRTIGQDTDMLAHQYSVHNDFAVYYTKAKAKFIYHM